MRMYAVPKLHIVDTEEDRKRILQVEHEGWLRRGNEGSVFPARR